MKSWTLLAILLTVTSCGSKPVVKEAIFDLCYYGGVDRLRCFPVNQPDRKEYYRDFNPYRDFVMDLDGYTEISIHHKELHDRLREAE